MDVDDYVKRGRIINALAHRECGNDEYDIAVNDCIEIAKQVPAADVRPGRWIPVGKQLPEEGVDVLCWYEYYHWTPKKVLPAYGIGYQYNGTWGGEVANGHKCRVLYWMPLPEPPKEAEK